jgi:hypothetical protein
MKLIPALFSIAVYVLGLAIVAGWGEASNFTPFQRLSAGCLFFIFSELIEITEHLEK